MAKKDTCERCKGSGIIEEDELFPIPYVCPDCKKENKEENENGV